MHVIYAITILLILFPLHIPSLIMKKENLSYCEGGLSIGTGCTQTAECLSLKLLKTCLVLSPWQPTPADPA